MKQKNKFIDFVAKQNFIREMKIHEHIILWFGCAVSIIFFIIQLSWFKNAVNDWTVWLTLFASISSVMFLFAGSKKKIICPILGLIGAIFLLATSWERRLFGFVIMQCCNIVTQIIALIMWYHNSSNKISIQPKDVKLWMILVYVAIIIGLSFLFAWVEGLEGFYKFWSGDPNATCQPYVIRFFESFSLMLIVGTFFPMIKGYRFLWWLYAACDVTMAITWAIRGITSADVGFTPEIYNCWSTFASNICMLSACIISILNWNMPNRKR